MQIVIRGKGYRLPSAYIGGGVFGSYTNGHPTLSSPEDKPGSNETTYLLTCQVRVGPLQNSQHHEYSYSTRTPSRTYGVHTVLCASRNSRPGRRKSQKRLDKVAPLLRDSVHRLHVVASWAKAGKPNSRSKIARLQDNLERKRVDVKEEEGGVKRRVPATPHTHTIHTLCGAQSLSLPPSISVLLACSVSLIAHPPLLSSQQKREASAAIAAKASPKRGLWWWWWCVCVLVGRQICTTGTAKVSKVSPSMFGDNRAPRDG